MDQAKDAVANNSVHKMLVTVHMHTAAQNSVSIKQAHDTINDIP